MSTVSLAVTQVSLFCYRNYNDARLVLDAAPVVLTGANGSGKTNLLEAISLLVPGRGLRHAHLMEMQRKGATLPWAVAADVLTSVGAVRIGTGRDPEEPEKDRRIVHIDGKTARSQQILADTVSMSWVTPDMDRVLVEGPSARRKLLDRLVYSFDPAHAGRLHRYEKALRERLQILRDGLGDPAWLGALEDEMAKTGVAIAAARRHLLGQLQAAIANTSDAFPQAELTLLGYAEEALKENPALMVEDNFRAAYALSRDEDRQNGTCSVGPHRSDLGVMHRERACPAALCSTGEQKALMIAIMLAYVRVLTEERQMSPILLLDDIVSHLDGKRRAALFDEIRSLGVQAWITGTEKEQFLPFLTYAQHFVVESGTVR